MNRRDFLKFAAMTGLAVAAPRTAKAAFTPYTGPYYVMISARGGWDPVYFCDPKPKGEFNRKYDYDPAVHKIGQINYAPIPVSAAALGLAVEADPFLMSAEEFFTAHGAETLVINGINTETNNHDRGVQTTWCGLGDRTFPALAAMTAAVKAPQHPLAFISSGGYSNSGNLLPVTRLSSVAAFQKIATPNLIDVTKPDGPTYHHPDTAARIAQTQAERLQGIVDAQNLPRIKESANHLYLARANMDALSTVMLPPTLVTLPAGLGDLQRMMQQTQLTLAAFQAGLAVSANIEIGGFDTHANHDVAQVLQLAKLFHGIHYLIEEAKVLGILDKLVIVVGSDFGRGKGYNGPNPADGKDHWPVTSMMVMSGDPGVVGGNRVVGATTDDTQLPKTVDPDTLTALDDDTGVQIKAKHIHKALRKLFGIAGTPVDTKFPLVAEDLPIFG